MNQIKEIDSFIKRISLFHGEDVLGEYRGQYFFVCCKTSVIYYGQELCCFVNKYVKVEDFSYEKIEYYVAKCIWRLIHNRHIEVYYAVNNFGIGYSASGKCFPQRTNECVTYSGAVFTDIDLPEELHKEEDARVFEMLADAYEELFDRFPQSLLLRSGGGLTHLL